MNDDRNLRFRSVVFGTDFSTSTRVAGQYAALFARHYQAELVIVHAFTPGQAALEVEAVQHVSSQQRIDIERQLAETVQSLEPLAGRVTSVLCAGLPSSVIADVSTRRNPALVVLGTHGGSTLERHLVGSVAEEVLRSIPTPVLTVGPHVACPTPPDLAFHRILYATDLSTAAAAAAPYALSLARSFGSELDVMHIISREALNGPSDRLKQQEQAFLDELAGLIPEHADNLARTRTFVEFGHVRDRIVEHATGRRVELVVLGAHHHSRLAMHVRTGPAFQVILAAPCPVLTISGPQTIQATDGVR